MRKPKSVKRAAKSRPKRKLPRRRAPRRSAPGLAAAEAALAGLAHEIRTPLNGILALSELIAAGDLPEREREWANQVKEAAEHLAQLTTLVVDGVRAETHGLVLRSEPFRPRGLAEAVGVTLKARAEAKGLAATIEIAADLPAQVNGDGVRLRAALENLADNALKFTERGRVGFTVNGTRLSRKRYRLDFVLSDSGIGMHKAEIARLFRPFAQANAGIGRRYGGSGLGLALVDRLARAMGGGLKVKSRAGAGSTFRLSVTVDAVAPERDNSAARGLAKTNGVRSLNVLCTDDNPFARAVLKTVLTELGHTVDFASSGEAAITAAGQGTYDLVLMDLTLPGMDGLAATRAIRALQGAAARIPIIGVSGRTDAHDAQAAWAAGMNAFMAKPVSPAVLSETINGLLERR
jgi:CheY-like chemotaxis protein